MIWWMNSRGIESSFRGAQLMQKLSLTEAQTGLTSLRNKILRNVIISLVIVSCCVAGSQPRKTSADTSVPFEFIFQVSSISQRDMRRHDTTWHDKKKLMSGIDPLLLFLFREAYPSRHRKCMDDCHTWTRSFGCGRQQSSRKAPSRHRLNLNLNPDLDLNLELDLDLSTSISALVVGCISSSINIEGNFVLFWILPSWVQFSSVQFWVHLRSRWFVRCSAVELLPYIAVTHYVHYAVSITVWNTGGHPEHRGTPLWCALRFLSSSKSFIVRRAKYAPYPFTGLTNEHHSSSSKCNQKVRWDTCHWMCLITEWRCLWVRYGCSLKENGCTAEQEMIWCAGAELQIS